MLSSISRALSMAMAAWSANEDSSATSSGENSRALRSEANSTPMIRSPRVSGTPRIATRPSSPTPRSIGPVWSNRSSFG